MTIGTSRRVSAAKKRTVPDMRTEVRFDRGVRRALDYILAHPEECRIEPPVFGAWCDRVIAALEAFKAKI